MLAECIIPPVRHWNNPMNVFQCNRPDCDFLENEAYHKKAYYFEFIHVRWGSGKTKYVPIPYLHGWIARVNMCCTSMAIWTIYMYLWPWSHLTHWGRVTHICVGNLTIIGSDNGLSLNQCWNIVNWTLKEQTSMKFQSEFKHFHSRKCTLKSHLRNGIHFVSASVC